MEEAEPKEEPKDLIDHFLGCLTGLAELAVFAAAIYGLNSWYKNAGPFIDSRAHAVIAPDVEYKAKYNTIAHQALQIEAPVGSCKSDALYLDEIIDLAREEIKPRKDYNLEQAVKVLKTIDKVIGAYGHSKGSSSSLLCESLRLEALDCDNRSLIYLAIAQELGLPLYGVIAPEHMFVRWQFSDRYLNWETTSAMMLGDDYYIKEYKISKSGIKSRAYLSHLTPRQSLAIAHFSVGSRFQGLKDYQKAIESYTNATSLSPKLLLAYQLRGGCHLLREEYARAVRDFSVVISLDDSNPQAYLRRGQAFEAAGCYGRAVQDYSKVVELNPAELDSHIAKWRTYAKWGKPAEQAEAFSRLLEIIDRKLKK